MSLLVEPGAGSPRKQEKGDRRGVRDTSSSVPLSAANTAGDRFLTCRVCGAWAGRDRALGCGQRSRCVPFGHAASNFPGQGAGKRDSSFLQLKPCSPALCMFQRSLHRACSTHRPAALLGHSRSAHGVGRQLHRQCSSVTGVLQNALVLMGGAEGPTRAVFVLLPS